MTAKEKVLAVHPETQCVWTSRGWRVICEIGRTTSACVPEDEAWADAASRLDAVPASKPDADEVIRELEEALSRIRDEHIASGELSPEAIISAAAALSRAAAYRKEKERG